MKKHTYINRLIILSSIGAIIGALPVYTSFIFTNKASITALKEKNKEEVDSGSLIFDQIAQKISQDDAVYYMLGC